MFKEFMVIASNPIAERRGKKNLLGFGRCEEDFNRLVYCATHHPLFYPDFIEVYDLHGVKRFKFFKCASDGTMQEIETV